MSVSLPGAWHLSLQPPPRRSCLRADPWRGEQLDLLDAKRREKLERLAKAADSLRDCFGFSKVQFGGSMRRISRRESDES